MWTAPLTCHLSERLPTSVMLAFTSRAFTSLAQPSVAEASAYAVPTGARFSTFVRSVQWPTLATRTVLTTPTTLPRVTRSAYATMPVARSTVTKGVSVISGETAARGVTAVLVPAVVFGGLSTVVFADAASATDTVTGTIAAGADAVADGVRDASNAVKGAVGEDGWFDPILKMDFMSIMTFGGIMGLATGVAVRRVGEYLLLWVGLGFIALNVMVYTGLVEVSWEEIKTKADPYLSKDNIKTVWERTKEFGATQVPFTGVFSAGFLLGFTYA